MKYKATKKFEPLGIENSYQGLSAEDYHALKNGKTIENPPKKLIEGEYVKVVKNG